MVCDGTMPHEESRVIVQWLFDVALSYSQRADTVAEFFRLS
jgi:hypothetical protein